MPDPVSPVPSPAEEPAPLLPAVLSRPSSVLWFWTLPVGLLLALNVQGFTLIEGNLDAAQRGDALLVGASVVANLALSILGYAGLLLARRRHGPGWIQSPLAGIPVIAVQVAYLWLATTTGVGALPASVTTWILPEERVLFHQFAFAMPPLFLGLFWLATLRASAPSLRTVVLAACAVIGAPFLLYVGFQAGEHLPGMNRFGPVVFSAVLVVLGLLLFLGLIRGTFAGLRLLQGRTRIAEPWVIAVIALAMPVGGLLLNRAIPFPVDFQSWEVYALAVLNGLGLALASRLPARSARLRLGVLGAGLPFTLYFFFVFLPYTPLSLLAMLAAGAGFLVLTPTFLFALHVHLIGRVWRESGRTRSAALAGLLGALLLPGLIALRAVGDQHSLNQALSHVFQPALSERAPEFSGSRAGLRRALSSHRDYKDGIYLPLLSEFYSWVVFNHLVLSDEKLARLERAFFGEAGVSARTGSRDRAFDVFGGATRAGNRWRMPRAAPPPRSVAITGLEMQSRVAAPGESVIAARLTLTRTGDPAGGPGEFIAPLRLPAGVFVTDFRLQVNGTWVPGRLIEKKAALWTYAMIRDAERRDPGLLYYRTPEELELRVYPVVSGTPVQVEFTLLVPAEVPEHALAGVGLDLGAIGPLLGSTLRPARTRDASGRLQLSGWTETEASGVTRPTYLHLIVDRSADTAFDAPLTSVLPALAGRYPADIPVRVTYAHHDVRLLTPGLRPLSSLPATAADLALPRQGGLLLDAALAQALHVHRGTDLDVARDPAAPPPPRPVFILLSRSARARPLDLPLAEAWSGLVETFELHELGADGSWVTHRAPDPTARPVLRLGGSVRPVSARGQVSFAATGAEVALEQWFPTSAQWKPVNAGSEHPATSPWSRAMALALRHEDAARSPGDSGPTWPELVRSSRDARVLLPVTSFIVVENEAQWRIMERTEARKLGENAALDVLETPAPSLWLLLAGWLAWLALRRHRGAVKCEERRVKSEVRKL